MSTEYIAVLRCNAGRTIYTHSRTAFRLRTRVLGGVGVGMKRRE